MNEQRELTAEELEAGYLPASRAEEFNPDRYQHVWSDDYMAFKPIKLSWFDDASYAQYQACDMNDD